MHVQCISVWHRHIVYHSCKAWNHLWKALKNWWFLWKNWKGIKWFGRWLFEEFIGFLRTMITYPKTIFDFCFENQSLLYLKESIFITIGSLAPFLLHPMTSGQKVQRPLGRWTSSPSTISHSPCSPCAREISHNFQRVGGETTCNLHSISVPPNILRKFAEVDLLQKV